jgi:hypothetical protein
LGAFTLPAIWPRVTVTVPFVLRLERAYTDSKVPLTLQLLMTRQLDQNRPTGRARTSMTALLTGLAAAAARQACGKAANNL